MTALAGATALRGQERASTQAAEKDHSSSDPGQENKPLLDENPDSNMPPPTDHGDMVPLWYSFDLVKKRVQEGGRPGRIGAASRDDHRAMGVRCEPRDYAHYDFS
jgi:oxalate decarboxylase